MIRTFTSGSISKRSSFQLASLIMFATARRSRLAIPCAPATMHGSSESLAGVTSSPS